MKDKFAVATVLALSLVLAVSATISAAPPTPQATSAFDQKVISQVNTGKLLEHDKYLSVGIGQRVAASPEEKRAASYIKGVFESYGYDVQVQPFPWEKNVAYVKALAPTVQNLLVSAGSSSSLTAAGGITAGVVDCGLGNAPTDFPPAVAGKIALMKRAETPPGSGTGESSSTVTQKIRNAQAAGAVAALIQNFDWHIFSASTDGDATITIPFATMNSEAGAVLMQPGATATFQINHYSGSQNVIATRKPVNKDTDTGKIVVISSHMDSVAASPGADDNASGTSVVLELSRVLRDLPIDTEVRFVVFGTEEGGCVGSKYYVAQPSAELGRTIADFNMDLIGNNWVEGNKLFVLTQAKDNPSTYGPNLISETVFATLERLGLKGSPMDGGLGYRPGSDQVSFYNAGMKDGANVSWRKNDQGAAGMEPWYHQPYDTFDRISPERITLGAQIVGASAYSILRPNTPSLTNSATAQ